MEITPVDIRHKDFSTSLFGYSKAEVREYLEILANEMEDGLSQKLNTQEKTQPTFNMFDDRAQAQLAMEQLQKKEELISKTLIQAENTKNEIISNAKKEAENMKKEVQLACTKAMEDTKHYLNVLEHQFLNIKEQKRQFLMQTRAELEIFLERIMRDTLLSRNVEADIDQRFKESSDIQYNPQAGDTSSDES